MTDSKTKSKSSSVNIVLVVLLVIAAFAIGSMWTQLRNQGNTTPSQPDEVVIDDTDVPPPAEPAVGEVDPVTADDHIRGDATAKLVLIEYSDYDCPFCSRYHPTMLEVMDTYGDDVAWVYRHYPLDKLHPDARTKAEASECLAEQGGDKAFWAFTDALYTDEYTADELGDLATELGYDATALETCIEAETYADRVEAQLQSGQKAGVNGTPGTIILAQDGTSKLIPGALPFDQVSVMIDEMLGN